MSIVELPSIGLKFHTQVNIQNWEFGRELLSIIYSQGQSIAPEKVDYGKNWQPVHAGSYQFLSDIWTKQWSILFKRENKYASEIALTLETPEVKHLK